MVLSVVVFMFVSLQPFSKILLLHLPFRNPFLSGASLTYLSKSILLYFVSSSLNSSDILVSFVGGFSSFDYCCWFVVAFVVIIGLDIGFVIALAVAVVVVVIVCIAVVVYISCLSGSFSHSVLLWLFLVFVACPLFATYFPMFVVRLLQNTFLYFAEERPSFMQFQTQLSVITPLFYDPT